MPRCVIAVLACLAVAVAACGGSGDEATPSTTAAAATPTPAPASPTGTTEASTATPSAPPAETRDADPTATPTPAEITDEDILGLVYWTEIDFWNHYSLFPETSQSTYDLLHAMTKNDMWLPYLIDLAAVPAPYSRFVYRLLAEKRPDHPYPIFPLTEELGLRTPEDDTPVYVEFKHRLIKGIQEEMGAFVDPSKPRTLSAQEIFWGGVRVDGIPPLESPNFLTPQEKAARLDRAEGPRHRR